MERHDWHRRFLQMAGLVAHWSKDSSTQVGAIIVRPETWTVVTTGYNGFARGVRETVDVLQREAGGKLVPVGKQLDPERWRRPDKYQWVEHAERNAIYQAARHGQATDGCVLYMNFEPCPCSGCARAIIQAGIVEIVGTDIPFGGKGEQWEADLLLADAMLAEVGVIQTTVGRPR